MAELQVIVQQEVGVINWNFEQLKAALAVKMQEYEGLVYTADNVKTAKTDIAELRKLKKAISDKRVEIKNKCLEPYTIIETQAAELTELLDKPINTIDAQLTEYENKRRAAVREDILAYFNNYGKELPESVLECIKEKKYNKSWENSTTATKRWKQGVEDAVRLAAREIQWIHDNVEPEFVEDSIRVYTKGLALTDVMNEVTRLRKQKEAILAKERERIAAEERAKAEAEMRARMEAEKASEDKSEEKKQQNTPLNERLHTNLPINGAECKNPQPQPLNCEKGHIRNAEDQATEIYTLRIKATKTQIAKIKGYIEYSGAVYREA